MHNCLIKLYNVEKKNTISLHILLKNLTVLFYFLLLLEIFLWALNSIKGDFFCKLDKLLTE